MRLYPRFFAKIRTPADTSCPRCSGEAVQTTLELARQWPTAIAVRERRCFREFMCQRCEQVWRTAVIREDAEAFTSLNEVIEASGVFFCEHSGGWLRGRFGRHYDQKAKAAGSYRRCPDDFCTAPAMPAVPGAARDNDRAQPPLTPVPGYPTLDAGKADRMPHLLKHPV